MKKIPKILKKIRKIKTNPKTSEKSENREFKIRSPYLGVNNPSALTRKFILRAPLAGDSSTKFKIKSHVTMSTQMV